MFFWLPVPTAYFPVTGSATGPILEVVSPLAVLHDMMLYSWSALPSLLPVTVRVRTHPQSRLRGHVETNTIEFEMGWGWVASWLPELASQ